ncbi:hypothetical protein B30_02835 [Celeribacter baekdonensis B30]|uniref:Uncharacterized protein n=1 Tax=Celeribacter baekdonensis B30 TaxID=1208323 RepID=K2KBA1_9RHOB|nr:hypothetical protein B30_02835 [Celeribacter baekdonensis B30]|tara:strand:- start:4999 stop:5727 length:729 start_codon:yes stop_codon:yes gene_type:complete
MTQFVFLTETLTPEPRPYPYEILGLQPGDPLDDVLAVYAERSDAAPTSESEVLRVQSPDGAVFEFTYQLFTRIGDVGINGRLPDTLDLGAQLRIPLMPGRSFGRIGLARRSVIIYRRRDRQTPADRLDAPMYPSKLSRAELARAAEAGYQAIAGGPDALTASFGRIKAASSSPTPGFQADFGALARRIERMDHGSPRFASFIDQLREFAFQNYPYGKGDVLFGRTCPERRVHNLASAASAHG